MEVRSTKSPALGWKRTVLFLAVVAVCLLASPRLRSLKRIT